jgi:plasmid stabilization system protein ParE
VAEADYDDILRWTAGRFGAAQALSYAELLAATLARLERGRISLARALATRSERACARCMLVGGGGISFCFASVARLVGRSMY